MLAAVLPKYSSRDPEAFDIKNTNTIYKTWFLNPIIAVTNFWRLS